MARCYVRNGVRGWTVEAQEQALEAAGHLDRGALFKDILKPDRAKNPGRVRPEWLTERVTFLRPSSRRGETLVVATPLALGINERDLTKALTDASKNRNAAVLFVDSGTVIRPRDGMAGSTVAQDAWHEALKKATTKTAKIAGNVAAAAAKRRLTAEKLKIAEPLWELPTEEISTDEISARSKLSVKTLYNELGPRSIAQVKRLRRIARRKTNAG